ncbi:hypothetical protein BNATCHR294 (nucleomorph) [Bigelowiella natans]|uniref:Uncharacterized protein n=1 Tax=Bigelowiella natans TaxID=227086 RepID=Q3LW77_BIGNA|nr:hypothetical protein BNATCHR294 [Bigelowiella natans]ABA27289.1 hypothetical protein [Bigelowiella natans]|mmetsp:Transcript_10331/g.12341  ORF Transcript_10331/g.12341 Transcript_10331/m.12341 type:complete len:256 (-) Transcript_10331:1663-2430(-)
MHNSVFSSNYYSIILNAIKSKIILILSINRTRILNYDINRKWPNIGRKGISQFVLKKKYFNSRKIKIFNHEKLYINKIFYRCKDIFQKLSRIRFYFNSIESVKDNRILNKIFNTTKTTKYTAKFCIMKNILIKYIFYLINDHIKTEKIHHGCWYKKKNLELLKFDSVNQSFFHVLSKIILDKNKIQLYDKKYKINKITNYSKKILFILKKIIFLIILPDLLRDKVFWSKSCSCFSIINDYECRLYFSKIYSNLLP